MALVACGALFAAGAVMLIGMLLAGELQPYFGATWIQKWSFSVVAIGLPVAASLFFFRWAANLGKAYDRR